MSPQTVAELKIWERHAKQAEAEMTAAYRAKIRANDREDMASVEYLSTVEREAQNRLEHANSMIARLSLDMTPEQTELVLGGPF